MSCAGSCLQTRRSTAWPAWPPTRAPTPCPEPSTTCPSLRLCTERATSEHSVSRPDSGPPAYPLWLPPRPPSAPFHQTPVLLRSFFVCLWPYLFCHYPLSPPSSHLSILITAPSHSVSVVFASHAMQQLSRFTKREREKMFFCFYFVIVFLHKMNKVNIFYYTEQKKVFFFTWLKITDKNCNKEKLLYFLFLFCLLQWSLMFLMDLLWQLVHLADSENQMPIS